MTKRHRLDYATGPETVETMGTGYRVISCLNTFSLVCSGIIFLLMLGVCTDRMMSLLIYLGRPVAIYVHIAIAGFPAWYYIGVTDRRATNRRALSRLLIRSLLPIAVIAAGMLIAAVVPKTK